MQFFHKLVISISILVFLGLLLYSGYVFYSNKSTLYPPDIPTCPDYWTVTQDGKCVIPKPHDINLGNLKNKGHPIYIYKNIENIPQYSLLETYYDPNSNDLYEGELAEKLGPGYYNADIPYGYDENNPQISQIDFTDKGWASYGDPYCEIKKWANINNIQWDGMSNYNKC